MPGVGQEVSHRVVDGSDDRSPKTCDPVSVKVIVQQRMPNLFGHRVCEPALQLVPHLVNRGREPDRLDDQQPRDRRSALEARVDERTYPEPEPLPVVVTLSGLSEHLLDERATLLGQELLKAVLPRREDS